MIDHDMACAVCIYALNTVDDHGNISYQHPVTPDKGHAPVPVPADQLDDVYRHCQFCSNAEPLWMYRTALIEAQTVGSVSDTVQEYSTQWHACHLCAQLIEQDDADGLTRRCIAFMGWQPGSLQAEVLAAIHRTIVIAREPGRNLLTTSRWQPAPLKAATLPKVRDRLAGLYRGPIGLPRPLHHRTVRETHADGLDHARLYWIDPEFTALVTQVHADLPDTAVTDRIVPSTTGLLVWAAPADPRHLITAASWTRHQDGWHIICYRSIGADLPSHLMETVRHDVGWLLPIHAVHVHHDTVINGADPLATLVTSWLLVAQQLAEIEPALVDPPIRKAYARAHRPAPEVRLVRIKPGRPDVPTTMDQRTSTGRALPNHRYWVTGHPRNQAYGPGRSLRKTIHIDPFLKGPDDKPIKASTTVRILGSTRATPGKDDNPPPTGS